MGASVYGVGASVYGSLVILVSALGPNPSFFLFLGNFTQQELGLRLGPGLDNQCNGKFPLLFDNLQF